MKNPINPKNNLFVWGPIDGRPIYAYYWQGGFVNFTKEYKPGWATFISYIEKEKFWAIADYKELYDKGEKVFKSYVLNEKKFTDNFRKWRKTISRFNEFKNRIGNNLDKNKIVSITKEWNDFYAKVFWNIGSLPEVANWGGEQLLKRELKKRIKNEEDFHYAMERLTAPEDFSFYQSEEIDLMKLKGIKNHEELGIKLKAHQQKYFWLLNNYHHSKILTVSYFKKTLDSITRAEASKKIRELKKIKKDSVKHKKDTVKKFGLSREVLKISQRLSFCIWWQDIRKAYIFQANHIVDLLLKKISKIYKVNFDDLHFYSLKEVEILIEKGKRVAIKEVENRKKYFFIVFLPETDKEIYLSGEAARKIALPYIDRKINKRIKEFKGFVVNRGLLKGKVRIIYSPKEANKMKKGEILVAPMTSPDFIVALRKASAVITDEGGMTCHAAIVSRELKIPGIVGTKIATKVLKDGDIVEVDANKGVIKILN